MKLTKKATKKMIKEVKSMGLKKKATKKLIKMIKKGK
jgi:hypothetical protein